MTPASSGCIIPGEVRDENQLAQGSTSVEPSVQPSTDDPSSFKGQGEASLLEDARFPPIGSIIDYAGSEDPSRTWLVCDGRTLSSITYKVLFTVIGTTYGAGRGPDTFNVPDLRGRVTVGVGRGPDLSERLLGSKAGEEQIALTTDQMPRHRHTLSDPGHAHQESFYSSFGGPLQGAAHYPIPAQASIFTSVSATGITMADTGEGRSHSNMQPFLALNKIIRVL